MSQESTPAAEVEDDVAELVADLAYETAIGSNPEYQAQAKKQFRWALNKLIDEKIERALMACRR